MPRLQGEGDVPMVNLEPDRRPSDPSGSPSSAKERTEAVNRAGVSAERTSPSTQEQSGTAEARFTSPMSSSRDTMRMTDAAGNSDFHQPEMANPDGNASLTGDVSLNTTAWDYAPWLQSFGRQLMRSWIPPPAYSLGILKEGGWATIEVEISRSGELLRLEVLEEQGHPSLSRAAQTALHSMGPIAPLPADFPEPTLILRIRMIYPRIRPRS